MLQNFKLKDVFTALNLFLTFVSMALIVEGKVLIASYILFINIVIVDLLDGFVARVTKSYNDFGKHFDSTTDFISCSVAPSLIIYAVYHEVYPMVSFVLAFMPLFFGVLRDIMQKIRPVSHSHYFIGFARTFSGLFILGFSNSTLITEFKLYELGAILITAACASNLSWWPYIGNNKLTLKLAPRLKFYIVLAIGFLVSYLWMGIFFDAVAIMIFGFYFSPFIIVDRDVRQDIKRQIHAQRAIS